MWHGSSDVHSMSRSCIRNPKRHASISILSIQKRKLQMQRPHCSADTPIHFGITFSTTQEENTTNIQDYFEINSWLTILQRSGSRDGVANVEGDLSDSLSALLQGRVSISRRLRSLKGFFFQTKRLRTPC